MAGKPKSAWIFSGDGIEWKVASIVDRLLRTSDRTAPVVVAQEQNIVPEEEGQCPGLWPVFGEPAGYDSRSIRYRPSEIATDTGVGNETALQDLAQYSRAERLSTRYQSC